MNDKILLILMVMLGCISCKNSQVIEYPKMDNYGSIRVHKIELTDTAAVIHVGAYSFKDYWFNLEGKDGEYYLEGSTTGRRYSLIGTDGIETNKRYTLDESGVMLFTLRFEPVAKEEEAVDVILDSSESLNIRGLSLRKTERTRTRRING